VFEFIFFYFNTVDFLQLLTDNDLSNLFVDLVYYLLLSLVADLPLALSSF
jgi:hypothetical protein